MSKLSFLSLSIAFPHQVFLVDSLMSKRSRTVLSDDDEAPAPRRNPSRLPNSEAEEEAPSAQSRRPSTRTKAKAPAPAQWSTQTKKTKAPVAKQASSNAKGPLTAEEQRQLTALLQRGGNISLDKVKEKVAQAALESKI